MFMLGRATLPVEAVLGGSAVIATCYFFYSWLKTRMMFRNLKNQGFVSILHFDKFPKTKGSPS